MPRRGGRRGVPGKRALSRGSRGRPQRPQRPERFRPARRSGLLCEGPEPPGARVLSARRSAPARVRGPTAGVRAPPRPPGRANGAAWGTFSIPPPTGAAPVLPSPPPPPPPLRAGTRGCPPRWPRRTRASRRAPGPLCLTERGEVCPWALVSRLRPAQLARGAPTPARPAAGAASRGPSPPAPGRTLCGARSSRWTPASWVPSARSSRNVNSGGRLGSGKLVLLKGSVSSKNCTRQASVAMMHPCPGGARAPGSAGPRTGTPGSPRAVEAAAAARWLAGSQAPAAGGGAGAGPAGPLLPLALRLLPSGVPLVPARLPPRPTRPAAWNRKGRMARAVSAALRQVRWRRRRGGEPPDPRRADPSSADTAWAAGCTCAPRPREPRPSCTPRGSGNRGMGAGRGHSRPLAAYPSGRGLNSFQMKAAAAGLPLPGLGKPQLGSRRRGSRPLASKRGGGRHLEPWRGFWGRFPLRRRKLQRRRVNRRTLVAVLIRDKPGGARREAWGAARLRFDTPAPDLTPWLTLGMTAAS